MMRIVRGLGYLTLMFAGVAGIFGAIYGVSWCLAPVGTRLLHMEPNSDFRILAGFMLLVVVSVILLWAYELGGEAKCQNQ